jgi:crotonobetainyl-CoA:carnitine CoA-transferase CaiB-like acyl-CoA transferase
MRQWDVPPEEYSERPRAALNSSTTRSPSDHPGVGRHPVQRSEFRLSQAEAAFNWPAPNMGQHTVLVCKEFLGMPDDEIHALIDDHILEIDTSPEASA